MEQSLRRSIFKSKGIDNIRSSPLSSQPNQTNSITLRCFALWCGSCSFTHTWTWHRKTDSFRITFTNQSWKELFTDWYRGPCRYCWYQEVSHLSLWKTFHFDYILLLIIFSPTKGLPATTAARLQRYSCWITVTTLSIETPSYTQMLMSFSD